MLYPEMKDTILSLNLYKPELPLFTLWSKRIGGVGHIAVSK